MTRRTPPLIFSGRRVPVRSPPSSTVEWRAVPRAARHMNGIRDLVKNIFIDAGMPVESIVNEPFLPGFYRPRKKWDMAVKYKGALVAALEFKSQVGSVGKNINNRFEEALGSGAYRRGSPMCSYSVRTMRRSRQTGLSTRSSQQAPPLRGCLTARGTRRC
jgi:hypothetical protein